MAPPKLLVDSHDGLLTLTLNRPDKLNAVDGEMAEALLLAFQAAQRDESVRAVRLRGAVELENEAQRLLMSRRPVQ